MTIPKLIINAMFRRNLLDRITIKKIQRRNISTSVIVFLSKSILVVPMPQFAWQRKTIRIMMTN